MTFGEFKEAVINAAKENGLADYELYYTESSGLNISVFKEEIKDYTTESTLGVCFRCIIDGKTGYAATENLSDDEARGIVVRAVENAKSIENEEVSFLHKKGDTYAVLEKVQHKEVGGKQLSDVAFKIQKEVYAADSRIVDGTESEAGHTSVKYALYNSNGLDLVDEAEASYAVAVAIADDGAEKHNGFEVKVVDIDAVDAKAIAKAAADDAISSIGAEEITSGKYKGILNNEVMYTFLGTYSSVFYAEAAHKGLSLLKGKEGEMIAAPFITLTDDPMEETAPVKRTFDGEGVAVYKKNVIENGKLNTLLYNLKSANTAGKKSTGNGSKASYTSPVGTSPYSFYINAGEKSEEELCKMVGDGVMVTSISGLHAGANPITGDFSLLSSGFLVKDGKKSTPIRNFTISGNFFALLNDIKALGSDLKFNSSMGSARFGSPSVLLDEISVAGK